MRYYQNEHVESYKKQASLAFSSFLLNAPNVILCLISAFRASTLVVWADTVVSLGETAHAWIIYAISSKMVKESGDKYNFGMGRLEVFTSLICDVLIVFGLLCVALGSVYSIFNPQQPTDALLLFCVLKGVNFSIDLILLARQLKVNKEHMSKINETETKAYKIASINDAGVGIISLICYLFRDQAWVLYMNPIFSIAIVAFFLLSYVKHIKDSVAELTDVSLALHEQDDIYDIVMKNKQKIIKRIEAVNCRRLNKRAFIEVHLIFNDDTSYAQQLEYLAELEKEIQELQPDSSVKLVIGDADLD